MAYQHFWSNIQHIPEAKFALMILDFNLCLAPLQAMGVSLADGVGEGSPLIGPEVVRFNGLWHCGHVKNEAIKVPIPADAKPRWAVPWTRSLSHTDTGSVPYPMILIGIWALS